MKPVTHFALLLLFAAAGVYSQTTEVPATLEATTSAPAPAVTTAASAQPPAVVTTTDTAGPNQFWRLPNGTVAIRVGLWLNTTGLSHLHQDLNNTAVERWLEGELNGVADITQRVSLDRQENTLHEKENLIFVSLKVGLPLNYENDPEVLTNDNMWLEVNALSTRISSSQPSKIRLEDSQGHFHDVHVVIGDTSVEHKLPENLFEVCTFFNFCGYQEHTECRDDGSNTGTKRCLCLGSYTYASPGGGWPKCYRKISYRDDPACSACEMRDCEKCRPRGVCYSNNQDRTRFGCACSNTRSGDNCETSYVDVHCSNSEMSVCFTPFNASYGDGYANLADMLRMKKPYLTPKASVHFKNKKNYPSCEFVEEQGSNGVCNPGQWGITLSTLDKDLKLCNLNKYRRGSKLYFENTVIVDVPQPLADVRFNAFCAFKETFDKKSGLNVQVPVGGETGTFESATVDMSIRNLNNDILIEGQSVYEGDQLFVRFDMNDPKELFRAIRVEYCTASTHQSIGHPSAKHQQLLVKSCPAPDQTYLTHGSNFQPVGGDFTELQNRPTGIFAFRLGSTDSWYLHCTVRVCQQLSECDRVNCDGNGNGGYGKRRRKRASAATGTVQLTQKFSVLPKDQKKVGGAQPIDEKNPLATSDESAQKWLMPAVGAIGFVVLAIFVMVGVIGYKLTRKQKNVPDEKSAYDNAAMEPDTVQVVADQRQLSNIESMEKSDI